MKTSFMSHLGLHVDLMWLSLRASALFSDLTVFHTHLSSLSVFTAELVALSLNLVVNKFISSEMRNTLRLHDFPLFTVCFFPLQI